MKKILLFLGCLALSAQSVFAVQMSGDVKAKYHLFWDDEFHHWMKTEANIRMDHAFSDGWVVANLRGWGYDSSSTGIDLDKAYIGYMAYADSSKSLSFEFGKNRLEHMFDSKVQFDSHFTGVHGSCQYRTPRGHKFVVHGGPFVLDTTKQEFGFLFEGAASAFVFIPITLKYSHTYWERSFAISQFSLQCEVLNGLAYAAFLINHHGSDCGYYVGYTYGKIFQARDWLVDVNFQYMEKQIVPYWDRKGVRTGIQMKGMYALNNNLSLEIKDDIDFKCENNKLSIGAIYTW